MTGILILTHSVAFCAGLLVSHGIWKWALDTYGPQR